MSHPEECQPSRFEGLYVGASGALFSFAMGLSAVAIPLLALRSGFAAAEVGVLVAFSACAQLGSRSVMGALMRRIPDKYFLAAAGALMALSCGLLLVSHAWWAFALSQVAQGAARGVFWTGGQTHVVRTSPSSVAAIARMNLTSGVGQTLGPFTAGPIIEHGSMGWALASAVVAALAAMLPAAFMLRLEPLRPKGKGSPRWWRRRSGGPARMAPGVGLASWSGAVAGGWRSMMNSFVPVVLAEAGHGASAIGAVAAIANGTSIAGSAAAGWIRIERLSTYLVGGIALTGVGLVGFGAFSGSLVVATLGLLCSGLGAGLLQTAGPALASEVVLPDERGEAIATAGTYRAAALLGAPLVVSGLLAVMSTPFAVVVLGAGMAGPVVLARRGRPSPTMRLSEGES